MMQHFHFTKRARLRELTPPVLRPRLGNLMKTELQFRDRITDERLPQHLVATVDGGPKIITFVVDGVLQDGGDERQFGWGRFSPHLPPANGAANVRIDSAVRALRVYGRALRTSEAVGNFRAGL